MQVNGDLGNAEPIGDGRSAKATTQPQQAFTLPRAEPAKIGLRLSLRQPFSVFMDAKGREAQLVPMFLQ
jgi:hypothetical protein